MKTVITFNSIASTTKYRLFDSGILDDTQSTDFAFLRLRGFYSPAAIFWHLPDIQKSAPRYAPEDVIGFLEKSPILVSDKSMSEMCGADPKELATAIKLLRKKHVKIPEDNLLYGLRGNFYKASDMIPVLDNLILSAKTNKIKIFSHDNRNENRFITGLNIQHPHGASGVDSARKLFANECHKLMLPAFQVKPLTYDTIDYDKLNWRKVVSHECFTMLKILANHPDNSYLLTCVGEDRPSIELIRRLTEKAVKTLPEYNISAKATQTAQLSSEIEEATVITQESVVHPTTIYQAIAYMYEQESPYQYVDYAEATKRFRGKTYQYKPYKEEIADTINTLKSFKTESEYGGMLFLCPKDLPGLVVGDRGKGVMINGEVKKLVDVIGDFAATHKTKSLHEYEKGEKFFISEQMVNGEEIWAVYTCDDIAIMLKRLLKYIESITTIKTISN